MGEFVEHKLSLPGEKYKLSVGIAEVGSRLEFKFKYSAKMLEEVKAMEGAKWHGFEDPPRKIWSVSNSARTRFTLAYLSGENVFSRYDLPINSHDYSKYTELYPHQPEMSDFMLTRKRCIIAGEMGTGKTRAAQLAMMQSGFTEWWWVGTKASLKAVEYEFRKWKCPIIPRFISYDSLKKIVEEWPEGQKAPHGIVFDESSRLKTPTSQRSQAAKGVSEAMMKDWGDDSYVILMSGSPAPKDPCDWWHQCEVAMPGFIREGNIHKFKNRLAVMKDSANNVGQTFKEVATWKDNPAKCNKCGKLKDDPIHETGVFSEPGDDCHAWEASKNEIETLYQRMNGLVLVKFKRDVLKFLPEKRYEVIECKPSNSILRTAKSLAKTAKNFITGMTLLRELSDGFQYIETPVGKDQCPHCKGAAVCDEWFDPKEPERPLFDVQDATGLQVRKIPCPTCKATGQVIRYERTTQEVPCPKEDALLDILDNHDDVGRIVVYAGFTGSVDRCVGICHKAGWGTIRVDGRGWHCTDYLGNHIDVVDLIKLFQEQQEDYPRIAFIGQPGAAGMGLTLTASPSIVYYSNDFNAESRIQSEDRIHRPGMDVNRGATIYDLVHLPTDLHVLKNLQKKRDLQACTLGDFSSLIECLDGERVV